MYYIFPEGCIWWGCAHQLVFNGEKYQHLLFTADVDVVVVVVAAATVAVFCYYSIACQKVEFEAEISKAKAKLDEERQTVRDKISGELEQAMEQLRSEIKMLKSLLKVTLLSTSPTSRIIPPPPPSC